MGARVPGLKTRVRGAGLGLSRAQLHLIGTKLPLELNVHTLASFRPV